MALGARTRTPPHSPTGARARLEAAGRRALVRTDLPAAIGLLERVSAPCRRRSSGAGRCCAEIGAALFGPAGCREAGRGARRGAAAGGCRTATSARAAHALVQQQFLRLLHVEEGGTEEAAHVMAQVVPVFERCGDDLGLCRARRLEAWLHWNEARAEAAAEAWERAAAHARGPVTATSMTRS